jgi:hypothetical protein
LVEAFDDVGVLAEVAREGGAGLGELVGEVGDDKAFDAGALAMSGTRF